MRKKYISILCVSLIALAVCAIVIGKNIYDGHRAEEQYKKLAASHVTSAILSAIDPRNVKTETEEDSSKKPEEPQQGGVLKPYSSPIDFNALWEINPEVIGWIRIPGTDIDYPILMREGDKNYYLTHDIYGEEIISASIYIEDYNLPDLSDFNTVIYGHNMNNGSMFGQLHRYEDPEFFKANRTVYIYLPNRTLTYQIFAARFVSDQHIMTICDNSDPDSCKAYLDSIFAEQGSEANVDHEFSVNADDRIITLATCDRYNGSRRYVVHAKLVQ